MLLNQLQNEKSPYLLQHANNPVNWFPWGSEAFEKAKKEEKPIFLSIGYSTCHWCHVMAHESFEDKEIAQILNESFISIKVDKEERPDIDSVYMSVCQAFTGSGGWPTSIFMTPNQKPFFAGTYFPKNSKQGMIGFSELLLTISEKWQTERNQLIESGEKIIEILNHNNDTKSEGSNDLLADAKTSFAHIFDLTYGGFGRTPKFPTPHNLLFLMNYYENTKDNEALFMVEKTLLQMYKGGIFDHIGYGFSRYSTDKYFLVPHFEKMLYDNALLILSYIKAFEITQNSFYKEIAVKISKYVLRELTSPQGAFYCAQDADSDGIEGKFYVFDYDEIIRLLGEKEGKKFNQYYGITKQGNFEGKNILNLLNNEKFTNDFEPYLHQLYEYRKAREKLHLDDKILTSWNSLMITAFITMYRVLGDEEYLFIAEKACVFIHDNLMMGDTLFVSYREGKKSNKGFLDDYSFYIYALINMYEGTFENHYLEEAMRLTQKVLKEFYDYVNGGFYLYGNENEQLIIKPKETFDGALPSGNSVMTYDLVKLNQMNDRIQLDAVIEQQLNFMNSYVNSYPTGHSFYLLALSMQLNPPKKIICVLKDKEEKEKIVKKIPLNTIVSVIDADTKEYPMKNNKTTFYVCQNHRCLPPSNDLESVL